jgi:phosphoglycerate kinase
MGSERIEGHLSGVTVVSANEAILDNGPKTIELLGELVKKAKTILWNGPLGNYEKGFTEATEALAVQIAQSNAHSIVGGGDTIAAIEKLGLDEHISFISTGGGAMLDFLSSGSLPGIDALR